MLANMVNDTSAPEPFANAPPAMSVSPLTYPMTFQEFLSQGEDLGAKAGVLDGLHAYFRFHAARLHRCLDLFQLHGSLGNVLEIGPFYGYTPFMLRSQCTSYTVLEGDDPAVYALGKLYEERAITLAYVDFFETFGPTRNATHRLSAADNSYDTILCWETMEHFNFNPVKFARELHRVLKPGGRVCVTVPNKASFQRLVDLLFGRADRSAIDCYLQFEDYESNGKKASFAFHWREYSPGELTRLFSACGFKIQSSGTFTVFQGSSQVGAGRRLLRTISRAGTILFPRYGTNVRLVATK